MPENKGNILKIKQKYNADLAFVEGKITYKEFVRRHTFGAKDEWDEARYVASHPQLFHSLLVNLKVEHRLKLLFYLHGYTYNEIKLVGGFGGSITNMFKYDPNNVENREYKVLAARVAIVLDVPVIYMLRDSPSYSERRKYEYLEFDELAKTVTFEEVHETLIRPKSRGIFPYKVEFNWDSDLSRKMQGVFENCRVDLHKTFYSVEFYINSFLDIDMNLVETFIKMFDSSVYRVILSTPILRDTYKLSIIGTYIEEQYKDAEKFAERLLGYFNGKQLFPYNFEFDIENVMH